MKPFVCIKEEAPRCGPHFYNITLVHKEVIYGSFSAKVTLPFPRSTGMFYILLLVKLL
jgi:hypothetical protein